jgi:hypothetical protein
MIRTKTPPSGRGFTLIELIIFIVIGAIILPASFVAFTSAIRYLSTPDYYVTARFLAEQKIEEITKDVFGTWLATAPPYTSVPGYTSYQWKWAICYTGSAEINLGCSATHDSVATDYAYYQRVEVTISMPDSSTYAVYSLISKRPKS